MTPEMLNMSKEELLNAIVEIDKLGKELEKSTMKMIEVRDDLLIEADKLESDIERSVNTMTSAALAFAEMKKLLKEKYGCIIM